MTESSPGSAVPSIDFLRAYAAQQGVRVDDEDLAAVLEFLEVVLPRIGEIEERLPPETPL